MKQQLLILAGQLARGHVPRLGQATAVVACLVLGWLLFIGTEAPVDSRSDSRPSPVMTVEFSESAVAPVATSEGWQTAPGDEWRFIDPLNANFGFRQNPLWLRITVRNPSDVEFRGNIVYKFPYTDSIAFHGFDQRGQPEIYVAGDSQPRDQALPRSHFPSFPVTLDPGKDQSYLMRVETTSVVLTPIYLYSDPDYQLVNLRDQLLFAALFGAVAAVCMYVVTVYMTVRDKSFLDFIVFSIAYAFYVAVASGMGQTWIWPSAYMNSNALFFIVQGFLFASGVRFFQRYLRTPDVAPRVDLIFRILMVLGLVTSLTPLLPPIIGKLTIAFVAGPGAVFVFAITIFMAHKGMRRARVVAFGWGFSQLTSVYIYLRIFDITPYTELNHYLTAIGCAVATLYFAVALALGLRRQQEQLLLAEKLNETRSSFMAGMSHELRTPLNAIQGFSEMMSTEMLGKIEPPIYKGYADDILNSSRHMLDLVDKILDISKLESDDYELKLETHRLNDLINEIAAEFRPVASESEIVIDVELASAEAMATFDRPAMKRVLENLVSNAIKFSHASGQVVLTARERVGRIEISVVDHGEGMDPEHLEHLLIPFEAVRVDAYKAKSGAGLGLPLANALVAQHGGQLSFDTAPGKGTRVTVTLPLAA